MKNEKIDKIIELMKENKSRLKNISKTHYQKYIMDLISNRVDLGMAWYGHFFLKFEMNIVFDLEAPAGVSFVDGNYFIYINPIYMELYKEEEKIAILKHEVMHVVYLHLIIFTKANGYSNKISNVASDIVINGSSLKPKIKNLPGSKKNESIFGGIFIEALKEKYNIEEYEIDKDTKYYYNLLKDNPIMKGELNNCNDESNTISDEEFDKLLDNLENNLKTRELNDNLNDNCSNINLTDKQLEKLAKKLKDGTINIDDHSYKNEENKNSSNMEKMVKLEKMINDTNKETAEKMRGFTPSEIQESLIMINELKNQVNWKRELKKTIGNHINKIEQQLKIGFTHPIYYRNPNIPGYKDKRKPKITTILDVSGSMSDDEIIIGLNEIKNLTKKMNMETEIIQVDAEVKSVKNFSKNSKKFNRNGNGGTILEPGFEYALTNKKGLPNVIVVITDGGCERKFNNLTINDNIKVIWLCTQELFFDISNYKNMKKIKLIIDDK